MKEPGKIDRIGESLRIIGEGQKRGAIVRMIGGLAVRAHCEDLEFCEREYGDVDLIALGKQIVKIRSTFEALGYTEDLNIARSTDGTRLLFELDNFEDHVDVFLDKLRMEHTIDLRERLQIENLTISVSDIIVTKLIIHDMNEKDYRDIISIMKDMELGHTDEKGIINVDYIADICSRDWGLYQDIYSNIDACLQFMKSYDLPQAETELIRDRFLTIKSAMDDKPKSLKWKMRSIIGDKLPRREIVEEEDLEAV
ncbi:MAG: hypothetical protein ACFFBJ_00885 [Promethearchaeota archaeon]